jgi:hypothetical protein
VDGIENITLKVNDLLRLLVYSQHISLALSRSVHSSTHRVRREGCVELPSSFAPPRMVGTIMSENDQDQSVHYSHRGKQRVDPTDQLHENDLRDTNGIDRGGTLLGCVK